MTIPDPSVASGRQLEADTTLEESKSTAEVVKLEGLNIARL
jgi:hypothetical protein